MAELARNLLRLLRLAFEHVGAIRLAQERDPVAAEDVDGNGDAA